MIAIALVADQFLASQIIPGEGEERTMERALEGPPSMDEQAFRGLYARTARPLRAYLARVTGNRTLADDLLQETYIRFLGARFASEDEVHQRRYLFRIATNLMRDHFRRSKHEGGELPELAAEPSFSHEIQMRSDVGAALDEIGPRDRTMLWLAYVEGASHDEIAAAMGLHSRSVRSMLFRARQRLAARLTARGLARPETRRTP